MPPSNERPSRPIFRACTVPRFRETHLVGLGKKLVKIFKKEVQVGDPTFDDVVYVSTDTPEETAAFLKSDDIRTTILTAVKSGGSVEIDERHIVAKIPGSDPSDDHAIALFVRAVLEA